MDCKEANRPLGGSRTDCGGQVVTGKYLEVSVWNCGRMGSFLGSAVQEISWAF